MTVLGSTKGEITKPGVRAVSGGSDVGVSGGSDVGDRKKYGQHLLPHCHLIFLFLGKTQGSV
jgi:hypothetical protein